MRVNVSLDGHVVSSRFNTWLYSQFWGFPGDASGKEPARQ